MEPGLDHAIDSIVDYVRRETRCGRDFEQFFRKEGIELYIDPRYPTISNKRGTRKIILSHPFLFRVTKACDLSHETGHFYLGHHDNDIPYLQAEKEADAFAWEVTGITEKVYETFKLIENIALFCSDKGFRQMSFANVSGIDTLYGLAMIDDALKRHYGQRGERLVAR